MFHIVVQAEKSATQEAAKAEKAATGMAELKLDEEELDPTVSLQPVPNLVKFRLNESTDTNQAEADISIWTYGYKCIAVVMQSFSQMQKSLIGQAGICCTHL